MENIKIALIGAGNLGLSIAHGLSHSGFLKHNALVLTKRNLEKRCDKLPPSVAFTSDNCQAVRGADVIMLCVQPYQLTSVLENIKSELNSSQIVVSTVTGVSIAEIQNVIGDMAFIRAMPNTAIAVGQSMTCLAGNKKAESNMCTIKAIFDLLGQTALIEEYLLQAATIICASGTAFWMRFIRASCQGAVQLGIEAALAQKLVEQTCLGAVTLLKHNQTHPEQEVDKVTTPSGCTVKGLNEMEHQGLSSAIIKGLERSFEQISAIKASR